MYKGYVPLSVIADRIYKRKILKDITEDDILDNAVSCIKLIGSEAIVSKVPYKITIEEYRGTLPTNILQVESIRYLGENGDSPPIVMRPSSSTFDIDTTRERLYGLTYDIKGNIIFTSLEAGIIEMTVTKLATNEVGELMIQNDESLLKAIEFYIAYQHLSNLHDLGQVPDKIVAKYESEYLFYVAQAETSTHEMSMDEREALSNMITTLVDNRDHRTEFLQNITAQEFKRIQ